MSATPLTDAARAAIENLKNQIAEIRDGDDLWPACILGVDEAQALVESFSKL